uniref:Uncharacterized protein n=1 Tax=Panagrellus redivivus TaxID=6233 RepID=A0A7E4ZYP6_PANRE
MDPLNDPDSRWPHNPRTRLPHPLKPVIAAPSSPALTVFGFKTVFQSSHSWPRCSNPVQPTSKALEVATELLPLSNIVPSPSRHPPQTLDGVKPLVDGGTCPNAASHSRSTFEPD